jgi:ParB family chromosome partitioning protein
VVKAFEAGKLNRQCAQELTHVKPERQVEILGLMESCTDYSTTFAKGLVLKTAASKRAKVNGARTPWTRAEQKTSDLLKRLQEAEQQQDFFPGLYRQYTTNLLKLVIYVRSTRSRPSGRNDAMPRCRELAGDQPPGQFPQRCRET